MKGIITKVLEDKKFFFIDKDYWCHYNQITFIPENGQPVEYDRNINESGKKSARNVKEIKPDGYNTDGEKIWSFENYLTFLKGGYFSVSGSLKEEFIIYHPKKLASFFSQRRDINKTGQIIKFFQFCRKVESIYRLKKDFEFAKSELNKLIPYINKAFTRKLITNEFKVFLECNVEIAIKDKKNFLEGFIYHFEAIICFYNNN